MPSTRSNSLVGLVLSAIVGLLAAGGAAAAIVSANSPNDGDAITNGPAELVDPAQVLNYGG